MSQAKDLGKLILRLNPYTKRDMRDSDPVLVAGKMDIYCSSPSAGKEAPDVSQIEVELDGPYRQEGGAGWCPCRSTPTGTSTSERSWRPMRSGRCCSG